MMPTYSTKVDGRRYTYYASRPDKEAETSSASISRVPAAALEGLITSTLIKLGLWPSTGEVQQAIRPLVQRIEIQSNTLTIQLDRSAALQCWRTDETQHLDEDDLTKHCRTRLAPGEELADEKTQITLRLPIRARFRGGRAGILRAPGMAAPATSPDPTLIKALARAHRWRAMLAGGEVASVEALATRLKQERCHVGRTLALAFLSPEITKAILNGEQPPGLRLSHLLDADLPLSWNKQRVMLEHLEGR